MANEIKNQRDILDKLEIESLNPMQEEAIAVIEKSPNTIILSPTGTGKTLAFALPLLDLLDPDDTNIQALIIVPSRELAIQIEQVIRSMGSGYKVNAVYGGKPMSKDKIELKHNPAILVGTPGRILDHFDNERFSKAGFKTLILDEFDKSLENGFEEEMKAILYYLPNLSKRILTSATQAVDVPIFVGLDNPKIVNYLHKKTESRLAIKIVISQDKNKLHSTERKVGFIPVSEIINIMHKFASTKGIKFYTTSKKSKLFSFLPQYKFPKVSDKKKESQ